MKSYGSRKLRRGQQLKVWTMAATASWEWAGTAFCAVCEGKGQLPH